MCIAQDDGEGLACGVVDAGIDGIVEVDSPVFASDIARIFSRLIANRYTLSIFTNTFFEDIGTFFGVGEGCASFVAQQYRFAIEAVAGAGFAPSEFALIVDACLIIGAWIIADFGACGVATVICTVFITRFDFVCYTDDLAAFSVVAVLTGFAIFAYALAVDAMDDFVCRKASIGI